MGPAADPRQAGSLSDGHRPCRRSSTSWQLVGLATRRSECFSVVACVSSYNAAGTGDQNFTWFPGLCYIAASFCNAVRGELPIASAQVKSKRTVQNNGQEAR